MAILFKFVAERFVNLALLPCAVNAVTFVAEMFLELTLLKFTFSSVFIVIFGLFSS